MPEALNNVAAWTGRQAKLIYLLIICTVMAYTGVTALREASTRFMLPFISDNPSAIAQFAVNDVRANPTLENIGAISNELENLSRATSAERFVDSRLLEQGIYYTTMPKLNQIILTLHIFLGVFCLVIGGVQFWPKFRQRFMSLHRLFGSVYIVTAPLTVVTSMIYLVLTPPHHIYDHLVAWLSLWVFGALALVAITMAVLALRARRIFEHQAWMALSFGCLIVAPMLRWNWLILGLVFPDIDQETLNLVTMGIMLPEVLLIGFGLTLVNRRHDKTMTRRTPSPLAEYARRFFVAAMPLWNALTLLSIIIGASAYIFSDGMFSSATSGLIPAALIEREQMVFSSTQWLGPLFVFANGVALFIGLSLLKSLLRADKTASRAFTNAFSIAAAITAACALYIGVQIGLETGNLILSGGTLYTSAGVLIAGFATRFYFHSLSNNRALMKESIVFLLCILPFTAMFYVALSLVGLASLPADYLLAGQGYVLPTGASMGLFFIAVVYVVYGQATREHG